MQDAKRIWLDGEVVDNAKATTHVLSHTLHYGLGVFEGIRAYKTADGRTAVFRLEDHIERLLDSARICLIDVPYTADEVNAACKLVMRENELAEGYIRPLIWLGEGSIKVAAVDNAVRFAIAAWPWGAYLGEEALEMGVRCCISSYTRMGVRSHYEKAKICGQYTNSVLAKREAITNGFHEAILLDQGGYVTEGTGENLFIVRDGVLYTPPRGASILAGFTRASIITLARDAGLEVREEPFTRSDLYIADEVFLCGTAAEVTPVREIDNRRIGAGRRGPVTEQLQTAYFDAVRGNETQHPEWLSYV